MARSRRKEPRFLPLTSEEVLGLFEPWPISLPMGVKWKLRVAKPSELTSYLCFWKVDGAKRPFITMREALEMVRFKDWRNQRHMVAGMIRKGYVPSVIIILDRIVVDGNHGLLSLLWRDYDGPVLVVEGEWEGFKASQEKPPKWWGMGP